MALLRGPDRAAAACDRHTSGCAQQCTTVAAVMVGMLRVSSSWNSSVLAVLAGIVSSGQIVMCNS